MRTSAISENLFKVLKETLKIDELKGYFLVGGTNLAIRYKHRISVDIDLFTDNYFDFQRANKIELSFKNVFGKRLLDFKTHAGSLNKPYLLQAFISENGETIKVDLVDWCLNFFKIERINNIPLMDVRDIGFLKLSSMCGRGSIKDAYDLNLITEEIPLIELWNLRNEIFEKNDLLNGKRILDPKELKNFKRIDETIENMPGFPTQEQAKVQWIQKVEALLKRLGL